MLPIDCLLITMSPVLPKSKLLFRLHRSGATRSARCLTWPCTASMHRPRGLTTSESPATRPPQVFFMCKKAELDHAAGIQTFQRLQKGFDQLGFPSVGAVAPVAVAPGAGGLPGAGIAV